MSSITILSGDWEILFDDENNQNGGSNAVSGMRTVRHAGASSTIYTTNQLYSAVADASDDFQAMGFKNPMLPTTPNAYTMENQYFIPRSSTQYLKEGAITADWSLAGSVQGDGVVKVVYTGGTGFVATDIGRQVVKGSSTGTLLDFDRDQDGALVAWIRPDDPSSDTFSGTASLTAVADGGTGASTSSVAGVSGENIFAAIQAIGSVPTATDVYIYQDRNKVQGWSQADTFQWWATDADVSLGIISILAQVKDSGTLVADGDVEVFARRYTALYDNFRLNVSGGGFSALPLASAPDINNTTGYKNSGTLTTVTNTPTVGNAVYVGASFAAATAKGVVTAGDGTNFDYYLIGDLTDLGSTTTVKGYNFSTSANDGFIATTGTIGTTSGGPTDSSSGEGGTVTIVLGHVDVDHTGAGGTEPYSIQIDCQGNVPIASVYERIKYVTRRGADEAGLFGAGVKVPGESYRGIGGFIEYTASTGTMTDGEDLIVDGANTWTARLIAQSGGTTSIAETYITVTDQQTSIDSVVNGEEIDDESGDTITALSTGGGATYGIVSFTSPKSSPFGTFTGTQIFGARGVNFTNFSASDAQAYILTDDTGTLNNPPNTVTFTVNNAASLDRILVARDSGVSGVIDKDQFGGMTTTSAGDATLTCSGSVDSQAPQVGYLRAVDTSPALSRMGNTDTQQEHKYEYSSRTSGAGGVFTLTAVSDATGSCTSSSSTQLIDSGAGWNTGVVVKVGMSVRNTTTGDIWEVTSVVSDTTLSVKQIYGSGTGGIGDGTWTSSDSYEINRAITAYTTGDNIFDLILDVEASASTASNTFTKTLSSNFGVVVNVRQGKVILPFTLNQTQGDGSTSVTVVRQPDNIAT
tara:strand:- start:1313 stop:3904 length:2592 start_codon:yes stop_codon:yes gene_type:complete